jgi:predicted nucleic acid-binding protein
MKSVSSSGKTFFDTNIFLYAQSSVDLRKQGLAQELIDHYSSLNQLVLSTQVVQEFYSVCSRKLALPRQQINRAVSTLLALPLVLIGPPHILKALENEERYQISFWDALILAAAEFGGAAVLFTEDLKDGQQYGEVLVRDPFSAPERPKEG